MQPFQALFPSRSKNFWLLAAFLLFAGFTAGGGRSDIMSLIVLRPLSVLLSAYGLTQLTRPQIAENRWFLLFMAAVIGLVLLYLVPLPPSLWHNLPGHGLIAEIDKGAGLIEVWRPISLSPAGSRNALFSLFVPLATGLMLIQLTSEERRALLPIVVLFGLATLFMSVLQLIAPGAKALWLYRITNDRLPVGLFSNRNHSAAFLAAMLAVLAVWSKMPTRSKSWVQARRALAIVSALVIVPVILATGSRAGLILGLIGVCAALVIFFIPEPQRRLSGTVHIRRDKPNHPWRKLALIAVPFALIAAGYFALSGNHDNAASRMAETSDEEMRADIWGMSLPLVSKYFPLGSGAGSFVETVKIDEPIAVIKANYVNHAHNDILEVAVTTGLAGLALMLIAASFLFRHGLQAWRDAPYHPDIWLARLASIFALIFIGASVVDYPLRVPSLMAFATVFAFWIKPKLAKNNPDGADR